MSDAAFYRLLADVVLVVHFLFVVFVVLGFAAIVVGRYAKWTWIRNKGFRFAHLAAIGVVVLQACAGRHCPLTVWESHLRELAGGTSYSGSFIQHWLHKLLFFQAEPWVFTLVYSAFGVLVLFVLVMDKRNGGRS